MVVQCCCCKRVRQGEAWVEVADPEGTARLASHGYCPVCAEEAYRQFSALSQQLEKLPPAA